jgi:hypothetical protein
MYYATNLRKNHLVSEMVFSFDFFGYLPKLFFFETVVIVLFFLFVIVDVYFAANACASHLFIVLFIGKSAKRYGKCVQLCFHDAKVLNADLFV